MTIWRNSSPTSSLQPGQRSPFQIQCSQSSLHFMYPNCEFGSNLLLLLICLLQIKMPLNLCIMLKLQHAYCFIYWFIDWLIEQSDVSYTERVNNATMLLFFFLQLSPYIYILYIYEEFRCKSL